MPSSDVVVVACLRCDVAQNAQLASHSFIKNGFLFHTDEVLATWVTNEAAMREFEACVRSVSNDLIGFSGARLTELLRPLRNLSTGEAGRIAATIDAAFAEGFAPADVTGRIHRKLTALIEQIERFRASGEGEESHEALSAIRRAAFLLWRELQELPDGFVLPRTPRSSADARGA